MTKPPRDVDGELATVHQANERKLNELGRESANLRQETKALLAEVDDLLETVGVDPSTVVPTTGPAPLPQKPLLVATWGEAVARAQAELAERHVEPPRSTVELLSATELASLNARLDRPLYERLAWDRWDYIFAFGAGVVGGLIDILLGTPRNFAQKAMADKHTRIGGWFEKIHERHDPGAPIDYQGEHFGGGFHRGLTSGHDLLRPLEGIRQFKDGAFRGWYFHDGVRHVVEETANQHGVPYAPMGWGSAVLGWLAHNACDFLSSASLPIPGTSWLYGSASRPVRKFVIEKVYQGGFNLRHLTLQTLAPGAVEVILRIYFAVRHRHTDAPEEALSQKRVELLALGHCLSSAINIGKVVVMQNPLLLNVPQLLAATKQLLGLVLLELNRTSFIGKIARNAAELSGAQDDLERLLNERVRQPIVLN